MTEEERWNAGVDGAAKPKVTARIVSVERVTLGRSPYAIVVDAFDAHDAKAIVEALVALGVRPECALPWERT